MKRVKMVWIGKTVMVFDSDLHRKNGGDHKTDRFMRRAVVHRLYLENSSLPTGVDEFPVTRRMLADIKFVESGKVSNGHFVYAMEEYL